MIAEYEYEGLDKDIALNSPNQYALEQNHKHLKEMKAIPSLLRTPIFNPIVSDFFSGMEVAVPLYTQMLNNVSSHKDVFDALKSYYNGQKMVSVEMVTEKVIPSNMLKDTNLMKIFVGGNEERINLISVFDNLGKGASGAAVQCMNIMSELDETTGLI